MVACAGPQRKQNIVKYKHHVNLRRYWQRFVNLRQYWGMFWVGFELLITMEWTKLSIGDFYGKKTQTANHVVLLCCPGMVANFNPPNTPNTGTKLRMEP
jgi:hypothetical protein